MPTSPITKSTFFQLRLTPVQKSTYKKLALATGQPLSRWLIAAAESKRKEQEKA